MSYRINRNDLCMSDPMPFSQHWEARVTVPIDSIEDMGAALHPCISSLRPGDLVNVCSFEKHDWQRLKEVASFRVVSVDNVKVETVQITETIKVPARTANEEAAHQPVLRVVEVRGAFEVRDEKGNCLEAFVERDQAEAFIRTGKAGVEKKPAAAETGLDKSELEIKRGFQGKYIVKNKAGEIVKEFRNKAEAEAFMAA